MKKFRSLEKILLILVVAVIVCGLSTTVRAADTGLGEIFNNPGQIPEKPTPTPTPTPGQSATPTPTPNNNKGQTSLPKTGANDTAIWILAGGCAVVAIFTYKKIRDYNV